MSRFLRFAFAGGVGFVVDASILALLLSMTVLGPFLARLISIVAALSTTWMLNRHMTFGPSSRSITAEGARYGGVGLTTGLANYLVYCAILIAFPSLPPLLALVAASGIAMALSYLGYSRLVFDR